MSEVWDTYETLDGTKYRVLLRFDPSPPPEDREEEFIGDERPYAYRKLSAWEAKVG